jgi:hypothetical protein
MGSSSRVVETFGWFQPNEQWEQEQQPPSQNIADKLPIVGEIGRKHRMIKIV